MLSSAKVTENDPVYKDGIYTSSRMQLLTNPPYSGLESYILNVIYGHQHLA